MICPTCGKDKTKKRGWSVFTDSRNQRYQCLSKTCGRTWSAIGKNPRLLYFDIETAQIQFKGFRAGKQYVSPKRITRDWFVLAWAAKWVCTSSMFSYVLRPKEAREANDKRIVVALWDMFNQADIIIGHNADQFDIKKMNWRFGIHKLDPPRPYRTVDTLKVARAVMGATSKSLDFMVKELGLNGGEGKKEMHIGDWDACEAGDPEALRKMREYNEKDILDGESLYLFLRPWQKNHPNMGLYYETTVSRCKNCGSTDLDTDDKFTVKTPANSFYCWTCINCGANGRTPESARYEKAYPGEDKEVKRMIADENREKRQSLMR